MREYALAGKFEFILTQSVSRLTRNLTDCIKLFKEMQNLDPLWIFNLSRRISACCPKPAA